MYLYISENARDIYIITVQYLNKSSLLSTSTGEEEPDGDPRPGAGGERHARQVHHPPAEEGQQL